MLSIFIVSFINPMKDTSYAFYRIYVLQKPHDGHLSSTFASFWTSSPPEAMDTVFANVK